MKENNGYRTAGEGVSSGLPGKGWNSLHRAFDAFRKRGRLVLICFLVLFIALGGFSYYRYSHTASTIMSLDYEEASKGLTPSQTRFNIFEIRCREVMDRLIEYAGLEGKISPEELSECISVQATHEKSISAKVNYISTSFVVEFTNNGVIPDRTAEDMLSMLCKAYREYFVEHYGYNHSILSFDTDGLRSGDEYLAAVDLLELRCTQLEKYVSLRSRESKNYQDPDTGLTFSSLQQRAKNLCDYDLAKLRSFIIENGITSDGAELSSTLSYKIRMDRLAYDKLMAAYDEDNKGIRMYDAAMSAVVMIPTRDQSNDYYMSRTKTGMDEMVTHADAQLAGAIERMEEIEYDTYLSGKLGGKVPGEELTQKADAMIKEMEASLDKLASDIETMDSTYTNAKAHNYIGFSENKVGFAEKTGLVFSLLCSLLALAAAFFCVFLRMYFSGKEEKI